MRVVAGSRIVTYESNKQLGVEMHPFMAVHRRRLGPARSNRQRNSPHRMFAAHGAPATDEPAFSAAPPMGDARLPRPVPKRRWSIERLEALFSGRASSASEPKPPLVEKQKSLDPDSASSSQRRPMTRWSSAPAESNLWRHGRQFPNGLPMALAATRLP